MKQKYSQISKSSEKWGLHYKDLDTSDWTLDSYAIWYWQMGLSVIPLKPHSKEPLIPWKEYQTRTATLEELEKWFKGKTVDDLGIGVVCGSVSNNLVVLDFDDPDIWSKINPEYFESEHFLVSTGSGKRHLYLGSKKPVRKGRISEIKLDVQGEGSYVVAPPSIHPSGGQYRIVDINKPIQVVDNALDVAWMIAEDLGFTRKPIVSYKHTENLKLDSLRPCIQSMIEGTNTDAVGKAEHGLSHSARMAVTSEAFTLGFDDIQTAKLFEKQRDYDLETSIYQVKSLRDTWNGKPYSCRKLRENGWCIGETCPTYSESLTPEPETFFQTKENGKLGRFIPEKLGEYLLSQHRMIATSKTSPIYIYNPEKGVWVPNGEQLVQKSATNLLGEYFRKGFIDEVERYIRYKTLIDDDRLGSHRNKIVLRNGVYNLETYELEPFNPELYAISYLPITYYPEADCPRIHQFIEQVTPDYIDTIYEVFGYCLLNDYPLAYALFLLGGGANGKTTLLNLLEAFIGEENVSNGTLQQLAEDRYLLHILYGKLANISGDIPAKPIKYTGIIKMLTGGDSLEAPRKYRDPLNFRNTAKLIFSCNKLPPSYDNTSAFHRRPMIIEFPNTFKKGDPDTDTHILEKITTDEELSGLFNKAVMGLRRLLENGRFSDEKSDEEKRLDYIRESDPAQYFVLMYVKVADDPEKVMPKSVLYSAYRKWCSENGVRPVTNNLFSQIAKATMPHIDEGKSYPNGYEERVWYGIELDYQPKAEKQASPPVTDRPDGQTLFPMYS